MCTYLEVNDEIPNCTHECEGCMWHEEQEENTDD